MPSDVDAFMRAIEALPALVWLHVIRPSWISFAAAPLVLAGYWFTGQGRRVGWWFLIASQGALLAIALVDQQLGLILIVAAVVRQSLVNWRRWGRSEGGRSRGHALRGALWALDLTRLLRPETECGGHLLLEVRSARQKAHLARAMNVDETVVHERLQRGCRAFAAWSFREGVVSWLWISTGEEYAWPLQRPLTIAAGDCHGWDAGTVESHRGRGLFTSVLEYAGWCMAREGSRTMWNGILDGNLASQRAHARAGMRPILRLAANHHAGGSRLLTWPVDYADERLVARAGRMVGAAPAPDADVIANTRPNPANGRPGDIGPTLFAAERTSSVAGSEVGDGW